MTAYAMSGDRERCLQAGMNDHVPKPFEPGALYATLSRWLGADGNAPVAVGRLPLECDEVALPPQLPGIDIKAALGRVSGKKSFLLKLVREFCDRYADAPERIDDMLAAGDIGELAKLAHSMRGVAGTVGAGRLAGRAEELEMLIIGKRAQEAETVAREFRNALEEVLRSGPLVKALSERSEPSDREECVDDGEMEAAFRELSEALGRHSFDALDLYERIHERYGAVIGQPMAKLGAAIGRFQYGEAQDILRSLMRLRHAGGSES
jgi:HPt (histidine-containing phosphotransfer) domain-containing protein